MMEELTGCRAAFAMVMVVALSMVFGCGQEADGEDPDRFESLSEDEISEVVEPIEEFEIDAATAESIFDDQVRRVELDESFRQVYWMVEIDGDQRLEYRVPRADGWSGWRDLEVRWNEGNLFNLAVRLDEPVRAIEFRGADGVVAAEIWFHREVTVRDEAGERPGPIAESVDPVVEPGAEGEDGVIRQAVAPDDLVISQSEWGSDEPGKICGWAHDPDKMTIHHTAVPSSDGGDPAARMRGMQSAHKDLGWCDIGYHFVVSQSGKIFQGRSLSTRTGAHTSDYNTDNIGISLIGNYDVDFPPQVQLDAAAQIVEWVHDEHAIALDRQVVKGHREWPYQSTTCPGDNLLVQLEDILEAAADDPSGPDVDEPDPGGCTPMAHDDAADSTFADFPTDATGYEEAVRLYDHGITTGCNQSPLMFCPNCPLTRSQMAVFLARAAGLDTSDPPDEPTFEDVSADSYVYPYIEAVAAAGITTGCDDDRFCPTDDITRAQAAVMIHRAQGWPDEVPEEAPSFEDVDSAAYYYEAVETMRQRCVTDGCADDEFCPDQDVTRGQAAAFISRAFNLDDSNPCAEPGGCSPHAAFGTDDSQFLDYPTDRFGYQEAELIYQEGITQGCDDGYFCPDCPTDRRQMVMFLARAVDLDTSDPPAEPTFEDVDESAIGYAHIEAAYEAGWIDGCDADNFCPNDEISRAQSATVLQRAMDWEPSAPSTPTFEDVSADSVHFEGVETLRDRCITSGCGDDQFCPDGSVPRSHAAVFIARALNLDGINQCVESGGGGDAPETEPVTVNQDEGPSGEDCQDVDPDFIPESCEEEIEDWDSDESYPDPDEDHEPDEEDDTDEDSDGESEDDSEDDGETDQDREVEEGNCSATAGGIGGSVWPLVVVGLVWLVAIRRRTRSRWFAV